MILAYSIYSIIANELKKQIFVGNRLHGKIINKITKICVSICEGVIEIMFYDLVFVCPLPMGAWMESRLD